MKSNEGEKINSENDFRNQLSKVFVITGINKVCDDITVSLCYSIFQKHFGSFTKDNFLEAFEFNVANVYESQFNHFYSFDATYMSNCLSAYRKIQDLAKKEFKRLNKPKEISPIKSTGEENLESLKKYVLETKEMPRYWDWNKTFLHIEEIGQINISLEEKNEVYKLVKESYEFKKKQATSLDELKEIANSMTDINLKTECRRIMVLKYLEQFTQATNGNKK